MTEQLIDFAAVRAKLRALNRGSLLIIAERAVELMPATQLSTLLSDFVRLTAHPAEPAMVFERGAQWRQRRATYCAGRSNDVTVYRCLRYANIALRPSCCQSSERAAPATSALSEAIEEGEQWVGRLISSWHEAAGIGVRKCAFRG